MSEIDTGGPAFPHHVVCENGWSETQKLQGMTLRDYFAAKAMQALTTTNYIDANARLAYAIADAMLKARQQ